MNEQLAPPVALSSKAIMLPPLWSELRQLPIAPHTIINEQKKITKEGQMASESIYQSLFKSTNKDYSEMLQLLKSEDFRLTLDDMHLSEAEIGKLTASLRGKIVFQAHKTFVEHEAKNRGWLYGDIDVDHASGSEIMTYSKIARQHNERDVYQMATEIERAKKWIDAGLQAKSEQMSREIADIVDGDAAEEPPIPVPNWPLRSETRATLLERTISTVADVAPFPTRGKVANLALATNLVFSTVLGAPMHKTDTVTPQDSNKSLAPAAGKLETADELARKVYAVSPMAYLEEINQSIPQQAAGANNASTGLSVVESRGVAPPVAGPDLSSQTTIDEKKQSENLKEFSLAELDQWKEPQILREDKTRKTYTTHTDSVAFTTPLKQDFFYDETKAVNLFSIPGGRQLEIKDVFYMSDKNDPNGRVLKIGILPNTIAETNTTYVILDVGTVNTKADPQSAAWFTSSMAPDKQATAGEEIMGQATYQTKDRLYPNKVDNVLTAMENIAAFQEKNGQFKAGQEYSYINMIDLKNQGKYIAGKNSSGMVVRGGGVCAGATTLSTAVYDLSRNLGVDPASVYLERWGHPVMYLQGYDSYPQRDVDATVELKDGGGVYDFRWKQPADSYIKIDVTLVPNGKKYSETSADGLGTVPDVQFSVSLSFTAEDPGDQSGKIEEARQQYEKFRQSKHAETGPLLAGDITSVDLGNNNGISAIAKAIRPIENTKDFAEEMKLPDMVQLYELKDMINSLPRNFPGQLGDYIRASDWYKKLPHTKALESALNHINTVDVQGQPLQCIGFAVLMNALGLDTIKPIAIGGASRFGIDGSGGVRYASELIPAALDKYTLSAPTGYGGLALRVKSLDDYQVGDLFVRNDIGAQTKSGYMVGHVGVIVGKKEVDGKTVLLAADANHNNDGKIYIYEVNDTNSTVLFGQSKVVLRGSVK